ncbi:MAG: zinc ribbon domain-containing protein [Dactylosporangium sp.]|nr:zinc ribbon domain-containing protein [Dactylosporangium sp.]NNJ62770.1 zinc ribbon domain-containing protein [Dactylosporangium sp.]
MPRYEYRCRTCGTTFEISRPMRESSSEARCPAGHNETVKLLSTVAVTGSGGRSRREPAECPAGRDSCCGGVCAG